jgi:hypothetical protein
MGVSGLLGGGSVARCIGRKLNDIVQIVAPVGMTILAELQVSRVGQNCVYIHRIRPYIWRLPCQKYRIYRTFLHPG